jgi:hypothetical protein
MNLEKEVIKFPIEVINIIQGLYHPDRRRILEVIINSGNGELTFEEIIKNRIYFRHSKHSFDSYVNVWIVRSL